MLEPFIYPLVFIQYDKSILLHADYRQPYGYVSMA